MFPFGCEVKSKVRLWRQDFQNKIRRFPILLILSKIRNRMNHRRKILIVVGVAFAVAVLVPVIHHYQLRFAVATYVAQLKAKGEPMELAQIVPPPVSPEKNGAPLFLKAAALLTTNNDVLNSNPPLAMRGVAPGKAAASWAQPEIRSNDATNSWKEIKQALEQNGEALNLLVQITNSSLFDFNLQYTQRFEMRLTHLSLEKKAAQRLTTSAIYDLHLGDTGSAVKNVRAILALAKGTHEERTAISQLVCIAITQIGSAATWELLQSSNLTDEQLADLQADWGKLEFIQAAEHMLPVEREGGEATLAKWRNSNSELQRYFDLMKQAHKNLGLSDEKDSEDSIWNEIKTKTQIFLWRYWWSYPDELRDLKGYEVLMNTMRLVDTNGSFQNALAAQTAELDRLGISQLKSSFDSLFSGKMDFHSMMSESIVTLGGVVRKVMRVEVAKQMTITAIALKRYQLKHGNYPPDLNSLVPELLPSVPLDPVDGQPLRYHRNADGTFLLYSIGENGVDDGGDPSLGKGVESSSFNWQYPRALDWVWPQPASPAEVQNFYDHPPK